MGLRELKDEEVVEHSRQCSHQAEERHEAPQHMLGHDVVEQIPVDRAYKDVEEFKHGHTARQKHDGDFGLVVGASSEKSAVHHGGNVIIKSNDHHGKREKREASDDKRHAAAPLCSETIAPNTDRRGNRKVEDGRHAGHHEAYQRSRCPHTIHLERNNTRNNRLH